MIRPCKANNSQIRVDEIGFSDSKAIIYNPKATDGLSKT